MSNHAVLHVMSTLFGIIGSCCLAVAAVLVAMWIMDGSAFSSSALEGLSGVMLAAVGAVFVWLARALRRRASHRGMSGRPFAAPMRGPE